MNYDSLDKKAVILENPSQVRRATKICYECGMYHRKLGSQILTYPCYMTIDHIKDNVYMIEVNKENLNSNSSVQNLGYFVITLNQLKEYCKEIFGYEYSYK